MTANTEEAVALLGCPFCGCAEILRNRDDAGMPLINCSECGAENTSIEEWNRRTAIAAMPPHAEVWNEAIEEAAKAVKDLEHHGPPGSIYTHVIISVAVAAIRALATQEKGNG